MLARQEAAGALWNLSFDDRNREAIAAAGGVEALVSSRSTVMEGWRCKCPVCVSLSLSCSLYSESDHVRMFDLMSPGVYFACLTFRQWTFVYSNLLPEFRLFYGLSDISFCITAFPYRWLWPRAAVADLKGYKRGLQAPSGDSLSQKLTGIQTNHLLYLILWSCFWLGRIVCDFFLSNHLCFDPSAFTFC